jgi:cobalt-precorrin 5A hydrolase
MVVRLVAPLLRDKREDPAVVVVDDAGHFAVSLLSGHLGGANALARRVAGALGAQAVVTTASEVLGTVAVDLLGREFGWQLENHELVTRVSAAVVNGERVGLFQEAGERNWWPTGEPLPPNLARFERLEEMIAARCSAALVITDRALPEGRGPAPPAVVYRPRSLVVGIGCNRGTDAEEIEAAVLATLAGHELSLRSVRELATVDLKGDEVGLVSFAEKLDVPIRFYSPEDLSAVPGLPNPSAMVRRWARTPGVCEPAALLAAGAVALLVPKQKAGNVTVAVARRDFSAGSALAGLIPRGPDLAGQGLVPCRRPGGAMTS